MAIYHRLREYRLKDSVWGEILITRPIVRDGEDSWGVLAPLKDTSWGKQIPTVSGKALSIAAHGWLSPLMDEIGPEPHQLCKLIPLDIGLCRQAQEKTCTMAGPHCKPGLDLPDCYEVAGDYAAASAAVAVALAWKEGRYVIVVEGDEFG